MTTTLLRDVIEPTEFLEYTQERMTEVNAFIQSGIMEETAEYNMLANGAGRDVNMPFFKDLDGDDEVPASSTSTTVNRLTVSGIQTGKDIAGIYLRDKAFGSEDIASDMAGSDPMLAIGNRLAAFWVKKEQTHLFSILDGVMTANLASNSADLISDISVGTGATTANMISADALVDAMGKLGDNNGFLAGIGIHSIPYLRLVKNDLIEFIPDSQGNLIIPTYLGKRVIVDDTCPTASAATAGLLYTTYIFGNGAIAKGTGTRRVPVETGRDELAGQEFIINRRKYILHPRGIKWNANSVAGLAATNAECSQASNWTRVYKQKNIQIIALVTNG